MAQGGAVRGYGGGFLGFVVVAVRSVFGAFRRGENPAFHVVIAAGLFERDALCGGLGVEPRCLEVWTACRVGGGGWKRRTWQGSADAERLSGTHAEQGFQFTDERGFAGIKLADFHGQAGRFEFGLAGIECRAFAFRRNSGQEIGELLRDADLLAQQFTPLAGGQHFHDGFAGLADEQAFHFADFSLGGFELGERDILFQAQPVGDRKTLRHADFEFSLAEARVVFEAGFDFRV